MRHHLGRTAALLVLAAVAGLLLWLRSDAAGERICESARQRLPALLDARVELGRCSVDPLRGAVEVTDFRLSPEGGPESVFAADRVVARLRLSALLSGRIHLERVEIDRPRVALDLSDSAEGPSRCLLDGAARLEIDQLAIVGARVRIQAPGGRAAEFEELDADLRLTSRSYTARISTPRGWVETGRVALAVSRLRLSAGLDLDDQRLVIHQLELAAGDLVASVRGEVETVCDPRAGLEVSLSAPLDLVAAVLGPASPRLAGHAAVALRVEGGTADPTVEGELSFSAVRVDGFDVGSGFVEARFGGGEIVVRRLRLEVGQGRVEAQATLGVGGAWPLSAAVDLDGVELARVLDKVGVHHAWPNLTAAGRVEVKGQLAPFHLVGPASLEVRDFRVHDRGFDQPGPGIVLQFDRGRVELQVDLTAERARLTRGRVRTPRSDIEVEAVLDFDVHKGLDLQANLVEVDLSELGHLAGIPWSGRLSGRATARGPYQSLKIRGAPSARDLRFHQLALGRVEGLLEFKDGILGFLSINAQKGRSRFWASGELDLGAAGGPRGRGRAVMEDARLSDLLEVIGDELWLFDLLRGRTEGTVSGVATVDERLLAPRADIDLEMKDVTYYGRKLGAGRLQFRARNGETVSIDRLEFDGPCGQLSMRGELRLGEELDFAIEGPRLHLDELLRPDAEAVEGRGGLVVKARLFGPPDHPRMEGTVDAEQLSVLGVALGSGRLALAMDKSRLSLKGPLGQDLLLDGRLVLEGSLPYAVGVGFVTSDLEDYLPEEWGVYGAAAGELFATGSVDRWRETRGDLLVASLTLGKGDYKAQLDGPAALAFEGGALEIRRLSLKGGGGTRLSATGFRDADGALDLAVEGGFDARLLEPFVPWVEQVGGRIEVDASVVGPSDRPTVVGSAVVSDGRFAVAGWPVAARGLRGRLEFSQNKLYVSGISGTVNGGRAELRGAVELKDLAPARFDLGLLADEVQLRWPEDVPSVLSGEVRLLGPPDKLVVAGEVDLVRLRWSRDVDLENLLKELQSRRLEARSFEKKEELFRWDLVVNVLPELRIDNNLLKVALGGKLRLVGSNAHMGLLGTLQGVEGGRAFFRGNELSVTRVAVDLTERDQIAATLDAHAETLVRDYRVYVHAFGPVEELQVDLRSEPELARVDIVTLLTLGITSRDAGSYSAGAGAGLVGETLFNIAGLDKQVKRFVPKNKILRDFTFHISTQYSEVSGMVEPTAQLESRFLTDAFRLRLSQPVISGRGRRAQAEYRFSDHMSAQAQWDNESSDSSFGDFGLDLKLRWERD